jgi:hypothetical protein
LALPAGGATAMAGIAPRQSISGHHRGDLMLNRYGALRLFIICSVRPEGAYRQWRKSPPRELSIGLVADERFDQATGWAGAS